MLRAMLDSHPELAVPPEAHSTIQLLGRQVRPLDIDEFIATVRADKYFADWQLADPTLDELRDDPRIQTVADAVAALYAAYARAHGKSRVGDKTPSHIVEVELLSARFPNTRFVHIVRDGRDVTASMLTMDFGASKFSEAARVWRRKTLRAHRDAGALGTDRYLLVRYEDLVADPATTLTQVCRFIGVEFSPQMLGYHERADELLDGVRHTHHIQGIRKPPTAGLRDWHVDLSPHEIAVFDEIAGSALDTFGYPRSGLRRSPRALAAAGVTETRMQLRRFRRVYGRRLKRRLPTGRPRNQRAANTRSWTTAPPRDLAPAHPIPDLDCSVVIPAYNAAETLDEQLEALVAQAYPGTWEIVVVDNGSSDATAAIARAWSDRDDRIRLVDGSRQSGAAYARNAGAREARGRNLVFCDADDIVVPGWLQAMVDGLVDHEFVCGPFELHRLNPAWLVAAKGTTGTASAVWFDDIFPFASSCNLGVRRDRFLEIGGFDERIMVWEDVELSMRLFLESVELYYADGAAIHYRYRQTRREFYDRARAYGACRPQIAERLRAYSGIEASRWQGARNWAWLVRHLGLVRSPEGQAKWLWTAGLRVGALEGSRVVRRLYL